jgi:hypothetical protein
MNNDARRVAALHKARVLLVAILARANYARKCGALVAVNQNSKSSRHISMRPGLGARGPPRVGHMLPLCGDASFDNTN